MRASKRDRASCHRESGCVPGGGFCLRWALAHFFPIDGRLPLEEPPHDLRVTGVGRYVQLKAFRVTRRASAHGGPSPARFHVLLLRTFRPLSYFSVMARSSRGRRATIIRALQNRQRQNQAQLPIGPSGAR